MINTLLVRPKKWRDPEKKQVAMLFNKLVINKLKAYAIETDQTFEKVIEGPKSRLDNELLELSREIDKIRQEAIIANTPQPEALAPVLE